MLLCDPGESLAQATGGGDRLTGREVSWLSRMSGASGACADWWLAIMLARTCGCVGGYAGLTGRALTLGEAQGR